MLPNLDVTFRHPMVTSLLEGDVAVGFCIVVEDTAQWLSFGVTAMLWFPKRFLTWT